MSTAANYSAVVQELYVSYFGRPADPAGLQNFSAALAAVNAPTDITDLTVAYNTNPSIKGLIDAFGTSAESAALYGTVTSNPASVTAFVNAVFENLFDRPPLAAGLSFWTNAIISGQVSLGNAALNIAAGAAANSTPQGVQDATAVQNKITVAADFTAELTTPADAAAYSGATAAASARTLIAGVSDSTVPGTYHADVTLALGAVVAGTPYSPPNTTPTGPTPPADNTYDLTSGVDTFVGGSGNNLFNAILDNSAGVTGGGAAATLNASDSITGGPQSNVLKITDYGLASTMSIPGSATIVGITTVHVDSTEGVSQDFSTWAGLYTIDINTSSGADTIAAAGTTTVTLQDTGLGGGDLAISGASTIHATVAGVTTGGVLSIGSAATSGAITATISDVNIAGSVTGSSINVSGGTVVNVTQNIAAATSVIGVANTASGGAINVNGGASTTTVNVTQSGNVAPVAGIAASNGITETAVVTWVGFNAAPGTETAGDLTISSDGVAAHSAAEVATVAAGGSVAGLSIVAPSIFWTVGTPVGASTVFTCTVANANEPDVTVSGTGGALLPASVPVVTQGGGIVEGVAPIGGIADGAVTITDLNSANTDGTHANTISNVTLDGYGVAAINSNALSNLSLADSAATVTVTDNSAAPTATTLHLHINNLGTGAALSDSAITMLDLTTGPAASALTLSAGAVTAEAISGSGMVTQTAAGMGHLVTIAVSGAAGLADSDLAGIASLTSVTSSSSGEISATLNATQTTFTGGAGQDVITIGAVATQAIAAGSASNNELVWAAAAPAGGVGNVTGFSTLGTNDLTSGTFDMSQLPGYTSLAVHGAAGDIVFNNVTAGTPLSIDADIVPAITVQNADSTGASDSITLRFGAATTPELGIDQLTLQDHVGAGIGTVNMISYASSGFSSNIIGTLTDANLTTLNLSGNCTVYVASDIADVATSVTINNSAGTHTSSFVSLTDNFLTTLSFSGSEETYIFDVISDTTTLSITSSDTAGLAIHGITDAALTTATFTNTVSTPAGIAYVEYLDGTALSSLTLNGNVQTWISADVVTSGITVAGATDNAQVFFASTGATSAGKSDSISLGNGDDTVALGAGVATSTHTVTLGSGNDTVTDSTTAATTINVTGSSTAVEILHADSAANATISVGSDLGATISALTATNATITTGAGANSITADGVAAVLNISAGNGTNTITASGTGDTGSISVGSGVNTINVTGAVNTSVTITLAAHAAADAIALGANASASAFTSIGGILAGDTISFADAATGSAVGIIASQVDSDAAVLTALGSSAQLTSWITTAIDQTPAHGVAWFVFGGDTYLVENAGGTGVNDTTFASDTIVRLVGIHTETAAVAAAHVFTVA